MRNKMLILLTVVVFMAALVGCGAPAKSPDPTPTASISPDPNAVLPGTKANPNNPGEADKPSKEEPTKPEEKPKEEPVKDEPTIAYGASWFLVVNDTVDGTYSVPNAGSLPVSMHIVMLMNNMDPASLEGEGEYSGLYYTQTKADWSQAKWKVPITTTGFGNNRGYAGSRFTFEKTGETLEGRLFVDITFLITGSVKIEQAPGGPAAGQAQTAIQRTHVLKTLPAPVGAVGRDVTVDLGEGAQGVFGAKKIKGKLYSSAEMDQQMYDDMMKQFEDYVDDQINADHKARQAEEQKAQQQNEQQRQEEIKEFEESIANTKENAEYWEKRAQGETDQVKKEQAEWFAKFYKELAVEREEQLAEMQK